VWQVPRTLGPIACRLVCAELRTFVFAAGISASMGNNKTSKEKPAVLNRRTHGDGSAAAAARSTRPCDLSSLLDAPLLSRGDAPRVISLLLDALC
jgi:hypothetical protein